METVHGTCLIVDHAGLLLRGPSGSGKSDLALRLVHDGRGRLVADDRVVLEPDGMGCLWALPPATLAGMIEVRGIGIVDLDHEPRARLHGIVDLVARDAVTRLPDPEVDSLMGITLPRFALHAFDASAPARIALIAREAHSRAGDQVHAG